MTTAPKPKKQKGVKTLKRELWKVFSEFVRRRDGGKCVTCGNVKPWKEQHAGHYVPAGRSNPLLYFDARNVNCQCASCNVWKAGNLTQYALYLEATYGSGILAQLEWLRQQKVKWSALDYAEKIHAYKRQLSILDGREAQR